MSDTQNRNGLSKSLFGGLKLSIEKKKIWNFQNWKYLTFCYRWHQCFNITNNNFSRVSVYVQNVAPFSTYKPTHNQQFLWRSANARTVGFETLHSGQFTLSTPLTKVNYHIIFSHQRSTTVSLEIYPLYSFNLHVERTSSLFYLSHPFLLLITHDALDIDYWT